MVHEMGDVVKVWSLQSFFGGGFLKGSIAIVFQDNRQTEDEQSVLLTVERMKSGSRVLDKSYEVYTRQTELVTPATNERRENMLWFKTLLLKIRVHEHDMEMAGKRETYRNYDEAPEFYIDEDYFIQIDRDLLEYPEIFI